MTMLEVAMYLSGATLAILVALIWATVAKVRGMEEAEMLAVVQTDILKERVRHLEEVIYLAYGKLFPGCAFAGAEIALWMIADELESSRKELKVQHNFYTLTVKQRDSAREEAARLMTERDATRVAVNTLCARNEQLETERDAAKARAAGLEGALRAAASALFASAESWEEEEFDNNAMVARGQYEAAIRALNPEGGEHDD